MPNYLIVTTVDQDLNKTDFRNLTFEILDQFAKDHGLVVVEHEKVKYLFSDSIWKSSAQQNAQRLWDFLLGLSKDQAASLESLKQEDQQALVNALMDNQLGNDLIKYAENGTLRMGIESSVTLQIVSETETFDYSTSSGGLQGLPDYYAKDLVGPVPTASARPLPVKRDSFDQQFQLVFLNGSFGGKRSEYAKKLEVASRLLKEHVEKLENEFNDWCIAEGRKIVAGIDKLAVFRDREEVRISDLPLTLQRQIAATRKKTEIDQNAKVRIKSTQPMLLFQIPPRDGDGFSYMSFGLKVLFR